MNKKSLKSVISKVIFAHFVLAFVYGVAVHVADRGQVKMIVGIYLHGGSKS